jgi:hypothetical protein
MPPTSPLDDLPLNVLLALQDAMGDPTSAGLARAQQRAADAGFSLECENPPVNDKAKGDEPCPAPGRTAPQGPVPMRAAPDGHGGVELHLGESDHQS